MSWANGDGLDLEGFNGAAGWESPAHVFGNASQRPVGVSELSKILVRFTRHGAASPSNFDAVADDTASFAYRFVRNSDAAPAQPSFAAWITNPGTGWRLQDYRISMPLAVYNVDANPPRRLAVAYSENNAVNGLLDGYYWPGNQGTMPGSHNNTSTSGPREWMFVMNAAYSGAIPNATWQDILNDGTIPVMYTFTWNRRNANSWTPPVEVSFTPYRTPDSSDVYEFVIPGPTKGREMEIASADRIGVFPNPYYAEAAMGSGYYASQRQYVTFNNLPPRATIKVFNLAGHLVRTLRKESPTQFLEWNLQNEDGWLVASGMYICHIELPDLGLSKVIKLGVISAMQGIR